MKQIQIEKRLPFGFYGEWGILCKRYYPEIGGEVLDPNGVRVITFEDNRYVDIGQSIQFKKASDKKKWVDQPEKGEKDNGLTVTVETTDAYYDSETGEWDCVIFPHDIVKVFGKWWTIEEIRTTTKHIPAELKFFYCDLKRRILGILGIL